MINIEINLTKLNVHIFITTDNPEYSQESPKIYKLTHIFLRYQWKFEWRSETLSPLVIIFLLYDIVKNTVYIDVYIDKKMPFY